jgi:hypothetical protein
MIVYGRVKRSIVRSWEELARIKLFPRRKLIAAVFVVCVLILHATSAVSIDYSTRSVTQLIDDLAQIDSQSPGIDSAAIYAGFIADNTPGPFLGGVLGVAPPKVPPQMRELVRRGPLALPELVQHLDDRRPTKLKVGNDDSATSSHQVGVDAFMFSYFSDEYDPRFFNERRAQSGHQPMEKDFRGRYTVKVGDVCYVLVGQIINRRLLAVRYQPSAGLVVNSPIEAPALAEKVRTDWGHADAETLKSSLLADLHTTARQERTGQTGITIGALMRLRLYFPDTYNALKGEDLKKRKHFEEHETKER